MSSFEFADQRILGQREVVAVHEASHAVLGYYYGEEIGHVRLFDLGKGLWGGAHLHHVPTTLAGTTVYPECVAHRLLAGEIGARIAASLPLDRVHLPLPDADRIRWYSRLGPLTRRILVENNNQRDDAWKVLALARDNHGLLWWRWTWAQHARARKLVGEHLDLVRDLATALVGFTGGAPTGIFQGYPEWAISGAKVIGELGHLGCGVRDASLTPTPLQ